MTVEILDSERMCSGYLRVDRLRVRLPDGTEAERWMEDHGEAVSVLPYDAERGVAWIARLFRPPVFRVTGSEVLEEACAGMIEAGDTAEATVKREAEEELGLELHSVEPVAVVWSSPGISTERQHLFLAPCRKRDRTGVGGGAEGEHESIAVIERSLQDLGRQAARGEIGDAKLLMLVLALQVRRPELFKG